jgi:HlyD family secretion protein
MSKKKLFLILGGVVVVGVIIFFALKMDSGKGIEVSAQTASLHSIVETVSASGRIQPKTKVNITSQVSGEIMALPVKEGDTVHAGQLLIVIDTIQPQSDLESALYSLSETQARLEGAKNSLLQAEDEDRRQKQLFESKLSPEQTYKDAHYAYLGAKSSYEAMVASSKQLQAHVDKQRDVLRKSKIAAPMDGIVTYVNCEVGEVAQAQTAFTQGITLMTISNLNVFEVEVEVDETEVAKIDLGQPSKIALDAFPDTTFVGQVVEIGNTAILTGTGTTDQSTNFKVKVVFQDTHAKIRPGMSATVDITTAKRDEALTVPYSAVVVRSFDPDSLKGKPGAKVAAEPSNVNAVQAAATIPDTSKPGDKKEKKELKGVFVIKGGKVKFVQVQTGVADQRNIEITSGLNKEDSVVTGPFRILRTIKEGDMVKLLKAGAGEADAKGPKS